MTPISRTLNVMAYKAPSRRKAHEKSKKTTVLSYANFDFPSCKDLVKKDR